MANTTVRRRPYKMAPAPCPGCRRRFGARGLRAGQRFCGMACASKCRQPNLKKVCDRCGLLKPTKSFPKVASGRSKLCPDCYAPRGKREPQTHQAKNPCQHCGKRILRTNTYPARVWGLKFCGPDCQHAALRHKQRQCTGCRAVKPREAFDYGDDGRARYKLCEACFLNKQTAHDKGVGFVVGAAYAVDRARRLAISQKVPFEVPEADMLAMYSKPCELCGLPSCVYQRTSPELGFVAHNVYAVCYMCSRWLRPAKGHLTPDVVVAHAQRIVAHSV